MRKTRIALIDDDPAFGDLFSQALLAQSADIGLTRYDSGIGFMDAMPSLADSDRPDLILLDIHMPLMDGLQVAQAMRSQESYKSIPIILLTVIEDADTICQAYERGVNAYLVKPYSWQELNDLAKHLCMYWTKLNQLPYR